MSARALPVRAILNDRPHPRRDYGHHLYCQHVMQVARSRKELALDGWVGC